MRKITLSLLFVFAALLVNAQTQAWEKRVHEGSVLLARTTLSEDAKAFVKSYLGQSFYEDVQYLYNLERKKQASHTPEIHYLHLDKNLRPMKVETEDIVTGIEEAMQIVRTRDGRERTEVVNALRTIINLMSDMHTISHIRIEGIPQSWEEFQLVCYSGDTPKYNKRKHSIRWSRFWNVFNAWHNGMTGAMWAYDYEMAFGHKAKNYTAGSLHDWASDCGKTAVEMFKWAAPEYEMSRIQRNELKDLHFEMMAKAGYRLGVLLEELAQ